MLERSRSRFRSPAEGFPGEHSGEPWVRSCPDAEAKPLHRRPSTQQRPVNAERSSSKRHQNIDVFVPETAANESCDICIAPVTT
ncbi:hypothetical protein CesoFtcFv8_000705 [Champsocephalus esox]|uniref:Uncharacterized protein n=2 Tax=Champsocephalus TaxID=52236 RepID=A0AAN8E4H4_CHAGU|nr:hypothetical protein CesoFtcFv8_000705 [Champsocephalus esox]KAK5935036.1 hypothetical protein CgunFtcFv8_020434 [Champsocephalus gunnari]